MYIVINSTKNTRSIVKGNFPDVEQLLNSGDKIVIVSKYSNTLKVPRIGHNTNDYGDIIWTWDDFNLSLFDGILN